MTNYGKHFCENEFRCKCGKCDGSVHPPMSQDLLNKLNILREACGVPLHVNCGYRCPEHNKAVGGVENSQHCLGLAADISSSLPLATLKTYAEQCDFGGIGYYPEENFLHLDTRLMHARWNG